MTSHSVWTGMIMPPFHSHCLWSHTFEFYSSWNLLWVQRKLKLIVYLRNYLHTVGGLGFKVFSSSIGAKKPTAQNRSSNKNSTFGWTIYLINADNSWATFIHYKRHNIQIGQMRKLVGKSHFLLWLVGYSTVVRRIKTWYFKLQA